MNYLKGFEDKKIAVWGGGGVLNIMKEYFTEGYHFYSARAGEIQSGDELDNYDLIVWGVGAHRMISCQFPPLHWKVKWVLDLNYNRGLTR